MKWLREEILINGPEQRYSGIVIRLDDHEASALEVSAISITKTRVE
jgi:hypothetical protein